MSVQPAAPGTPGLPLPRPVHQLDFGVLAALVGRALPHQAMTACEPMPGGASTRQYFRVRFAGKSPAMPSTAVGMFVPEGPKAEEVDKSGHAAVRWPFLEVRDLLAARGVDVPAIYGEDTDRGWVLLEDLGDDTLASFLGARPGEREAMYRRAVSNLASAQHALGTLPPGCVVASREFDDELLCWEIHHFREWALEARGVFLAPDDRVLYGALAERLARRIAAWPRAFVHRDYQSRNLMVRADRRLCWVDFQDALLGPRVYDLVALLNDSYQQFDAQFVEERLDEYARVRGLGAEDRARLGREFELVTVQRKLKDAGRFVFIDRMRNNPSFLPFVEPTIAKVRASLARLRDDPDMRALDELLARVLP